MSDERPIRTVLMAVLLKFGGRIVLTPEDMENAKASLASGRLLHFDGEGRLEVR